MCDLFNLKFVFFFKQKTAYEMRISDWSSDVCSSDLARRGARCRSPPRGRAAAAREPALRPGTGARRCRLRQGRWWRFGKGLACARPRRSEEHTSELQSLMRISYAVFCLKKNKSKTHILTTSHANCE